MRNKIILVNVIIVLIVGLLSWVLVRSSLDAAGRPTGAAVDDAKHAVQGASARLPARRAPHRALASICAAEPATADAVNRGTASAQGEAATARCDAVARRGQGGLRERAVARRVVDAKARWSAATARA